MILFSVLLLFVTQDYHLCYVIFLYITQAVYVQDDVFVHTSTSVASNYSANIIRGQISIVEKVCTFILISI